jgi:hypothetical protein
VINIESNRETAAQIKARQSQAARYLKRFPNPNGDAVTFVPIKEAPAPGRADRGPTLAEIVNKRLPDCITDPVPGKSVAATNPPVSFNHVAATATNWSQCPFCAARRDKQRERIAKQRSARTAWRKKLNAN